MSPGEVGLRGAREHPRTAALAAAMHMDRAAGRAVARRSGVGSELNWYFGRLALLDLVDEAGRTVLPHQQHRALRAETLVAAVGGPGCPLTRLHVPARHRHAAVFL